MARHPPAAPSGDEDNRLHSDLNSESTMDTSRRALIAMLAGRGASSLVRAQTAGQNVKKNGRTDDLYSLPPNLPVPIDDGACRHLTGMQVPHVRLSRSQE